MKILIVEDDVNSRVFLERALLSQGYTVESAANGAQALEQAILSPPDLIISDILMPEMDGFEFCRRVKTNERLHTIPFIFYTATYIEQKDEKLAIALGASRFLIKPMEPEEFFRIISGVIEEYKARHLPVQDELLREMPALDSMQVEALARKLDKKVRELEEERKELRRVHRDWENIFQAIGHPTIILDPQHTILSVNKATVKAAGAGSAEELIGRKCYEIFHRAGVPPEGCPLVRMLASAKLEESEMEVEAFGGIYLVSCTPVFDEKGDLQKIIHIATDISERKLAEKRILAEKEFTDTTLNAQRDTFFLFEPFTGKALRWNRIFSEISGYTDEEIARMPAPASYYSPEDLERATVVMQKILEEGSGRVELELICKDGRRVPTEYQVSVIYDDLEKPKYLISVGRDITERKRAEEALRESESRLVSAQTSAHLGSWELSIDRQTGFWSAEMFRLFDRDPELGVPSFAEFLEGVHPGDRERIRHLVSQAITERKSYNDAYRIIKPDGSVRWIEGQGDPVCDNENKLINLVGTAQDITERKRAEEELRKSESTWHTLLNIPIAAAFLLDPNGVCLAVNDTLANRLGKKATDIVGKIIWDFFPSDVSARRKAHFEGILRDKKQARYEDERQGMWNDSIVTPILDENGEVTKVAVFGFDITDRKLVEESLRKEKTFSDTMINSLPGIFYLFDENGYFLRWNRNFEIVSGYSSEEMGNINPLDLFSGEENKLVGESIQEVFIKGESHVEANFISKDGRRTAYYFTGLRFISDNRPYLVGMGIDITERIRAEEALRESEGRFRKLFEESNISIIIHDKNSGETIDANVLAIKSYGFSTLEELQNNEFWIEPPYSLKEALEWIHKADREGSQHFEWLSRRITGEIFWEDVRLSKITINGIERILSTSINITDRKQAEDEIRKLNTELEQRVIERTAQLEAINIELGNEITEREQREDKIRRQNILLEGINWIVREALTVETEEELSSQSLAIAEELTGSKFGFIDELNEAGTMDSIALSDPGWEVCRMPHTDAAILLKNIPVRGIYADAVKKGISVIVNDPGSHPDRVTVPEGHPQITAFLGVPLKQEGKVIGLIGLANKESGYDQDDQQAIEMVSVAFVEALSRIRSENLITTLNKELQQGLDALSHANKELEAFSYSVSHDLRSPLRAIDGFTEILLREYSSKLDDEGKRICSIITGNSKKMGQLIDELLSLSRLGRAEMHFTSIDMNALAISVYDELTTPELRLRIDFHSDDLRKAHGDPILMKQVWVNLVSNAIKFSSHRERPAISVTCREEADQLVYCVKDNGAGFNMHYAGKLFGVFQRLHSDRDFEGTGVGLAIVQRIIHRHGGKIWADGEVDKGATFCFSIPREEGNSE